MSRSPSRAASPGHLERDEDLRRHRQPTAVGGGVERSGSNQLSMAARAARQGLCRIREARNVRVHDH
jgi:hypothetical protein